MEISIHAPRGGSDDLGLADPAEGNDFNPRSPWGERPSPGGAVPDRRDFNPRSPWGERRRAFIQAQRILRISIHAPRGGSDFVFGVMGFVNVISIHAPRGGSDRWPCLDQRRSVLISIHAPRGGSDPGRSYRSQSQGEFQSTLPVGGAT